MELNKQPQDFVFNYKNVSNSAMLMFDTRLINYCTLDYWTHQQQNVLLFGTKPKLPFFLSHHLTLSFE